MHRNGCHLMIATLCLVLVAGLSLTGCAKREKVVEINTPGGGVEVDKVTKPDGDVEIQVDTEKR